MHRRRPRWFPQVSKQRWRKVRAVCTVCWRKVWVQWAHVRVYICGGRRPPGLYISHTKVAVVDYLGFLMRTDAISDAGGCPSGLSPPTRTHIRIQTHTHLVTTIYAGFLNHRFRWCWGAEYELSYALYSHGWFVAYR